MKRILITPGEPAGIGPDLVAQIAQRNFSEELVIVADPALLETRAAKLNLSLKLIPTDLEQIATKHSPGTMKFISVPLKEPATAGMLNINNAPYVLKCLEIATDICLKKKAHALVTGPVQKSLLNEANIAFTGHTEFLQHRCKSPEALMLFVVDKLKVALATQHIPLAKVPTAITQEKIINSLTLLHTALTKQFLIKNPTILVCGLNPHAGENGHLGREEIDIISPALHKLSAQGVQVRGPLPADTIFTPALLATADAILAMYHDQALPVIKHMGFDRAVNVTLGLPIIRTSVDHGTALDLAGTGKANPGSLLAAIDLAARLAL